ncbi:MAG: hypothetical protein ACI4VI_04385 [Acutalibacteraceae bacterium]
MSDDKNNDNIITMLPIDEEMSPYDISYPTHFFTASILTKLNQAESAIERIYKTVLSDTSIASQIKHATKKGIRLVVDVTESTLDAIDKGKIKLTTEKSGKVFAQIRKADGKYGSKLPIKKEIISKEIDPVQLANTLQMKALQDQIMEIADQIALIDSSVQEVLQGQQNDRIGLYYSGAALFIEAQNVTNPEMKQLLTAQALKSLSDATFQLTLKIQSDIKYLANREYDTTKGKKSRESLIASRMNDINQSFAFIHQATMLKAGTYCEMGELQSMSTVLDEYSYFIRHTIAQNSSLLAQCDTADNGAENGIWKSRAKLELNVNNFTSKIKSSEKVLYLDTIKEE